MSKSSFKEDLTYVYWSTWANCYTVYVYWSTWANCYTVYVYWSTWAKCYTELKPPPMKPSCVQLYADDTELLGFSLDLTYCLRGVQYQCLFSSLDIEICCTSRALYTALLTSQSQLAIDSVNHTINAPFNPAKEFLCERKIFYLLYQLIDGGSSSNT